MNPIAPLAKWGALACAAALLSTCTVIVDEGPGRPPPRPDGPQFCTLQYDPVCGERGNIRRTFGNACMANVEGYRIVHSGECRRPGGWPPQSDRPQFCTREYNPVCARSGNRIRTFGNACEARAADYQIIRPGEC